MTDKAKEAKKKEAESSVWDTVGYVGGGLAVAAQGVAAYYQALTRKQTLRIQGSALDFQASMADQQASAARDQALLLVEAGNFEESIRGMEAGSDKANAQLDAARRGVVVAAGSAAEVRASIEIARQMDVRTIRTNARRASQQARRAEVSARNRAGALRVSAENARDAANSVNPGLVALGAVGSATAGISSGFM